MTTSLVLKSVPRAHQLKVYDDQWARLYFALLWEMGLGKTKTMLDVASRLHHEGLIDALLVVAPNSVYRNWLTQEMPPHLSAPYVGMAYRTRGAKREKARIRSLLMLSPDHVPEWLGKLRVVVMSYDSLRTAHGEEFARKFVTVYRTMIVADESTAMKNGKTVTAKKMKEIRSFCHYAWISTGTPVAQSPFDIHSQVDFLDPHFWRNHGLRSFEAFKNEFGIFELRRVGGGRMFNQRVAYRRLDYLQKILEPISSRLLKEDSGVDLPPKVYTTRTFQMTDEQIRAYEELRSEFMTELDNGAIVEAPMALTRVTRLQQICSGFVTAEDPAQGTLGFDDLTPEEILDRPDGRLAVLRAIDRAEKEEIRVSDESKLEDAYDLWTKSLPASASVQIFPTIRVPADSPDPLAATIAAMLPPQPREVVRRVVDLVPPGENPRLQLCLGLIEEACHKVIVWCRFTRDVEILCEALGEAAVRYDGKVKSADREIALARFKDPYDPVKVFVANTHAISQGVTLTIAKTVIYYSNSRSPEKRLQSEDRAHRIGQDVSVQIIDLVAEGTVDVKILEEHLQKFQTAAEAMGDQYRAWISLSPATEDDDE